LYVSFQHSLPNISEPSRYDHVCLMLMLMILKTVNVQLQDVLDGITFIPSIM